MGKTTPKCQLLNLAAARGRGEGYSCKQVSEVPDVLPWVALISVSLIAKVCSRHDRNRQGEFLVQE